MGTLYKSAAKPAVDLDNLLTLGDFIEEEKPRRQRRVKSDEEKMMARQIREENRKHLEHQVSAYYKHLVGETVSTVFLSFVPSPALRKILRQLRQQVVREQEELLRKLDA